MKNSPDPSVHQQSERQMIEHVERLLADERLRVDTTRGRRPVTSFFRSVESGDHGVELKRLMSEMGKPDRGLQAKLPVGCWMDVTLSQKKWFLFKQPVGRLQVVCLSPVRDLIAGRAPQPLGSSDVQKILTQMSMAHRGSDIPSTVVVVSTSGFDLEVNEMAERRADRTLILAAPNEAGGWTVTGPVETKALVDLFDPEAEQQKRLRIRKSIEEHQAELLSGGVATDKVAARTQLPLQVVEAELKSYAKENPGLQAKRLDGRIVLFREGFSGATPEQPAGDATMGIIDRVRTLFGRKGDDAKKIAHLSEQRAGLSQRRERIYEDISQLEKKESELREQFKSSASALTKRRLTSQILQMGKDIERRHQMLSMISQQVNVVETHLHNLELVRQGQGAKLPDSEELTQEAVKAEEMLAQLQADNEVAGTVSGIASGGLSDEEQALFEELEREAAAEQKPVANAIKLDTVETPQERAQERQQQSQPAELEPPAPPPVPPQRERARPEPG